LRIGDPGVRDDCARATPAFGTTAPGRPDSILLAGLASAIRIVAFLIQVTAITLVHESIWSGTVKMLSLASVDAAVCD